MSYHCAFERSLHSVLGGYRNPLYSVPSPLCSVAPSTVAQRLWLDRSLHSVLGGYRNPLYSVLSPLCSVAPNSVPLWL